MQAGWSPRRSSPARDASPGRGGGHTAGMRNASDGVANLVFGGGGHMPVLNGGGANSRANSRAGATAEGRPAGAPINNQTVHRRAMEMNLERKQKMPARSVIDQYDAYLDASEEHTFSKLRANLARQERKAEREHTHMKDAAGMSAEKRNAMADARAEGRREKSPARFAGCEVSRMHEQTGSSVASLLKHDVPDPYAHGQRAASPRRGNSPRRGEYTPRGDGDSTDRRNANEAAMMMRQGQHSSQQVGQRFGRAPSPRIGRIMSGEESPRMERGAPSPRGQRAPSPRREAPRAQSPFRMRPGPE